MIYDAGKIADFAIMFYNEANTPINNLRLQKVMYYIQAEYIIKNNCPCFHDNIEAWDFGPVIPQLYDRYNTYGSKNIPVVNTDVSDIALEDIAYLRRILKKYIKYSTNDFTKMAYESQPWKNAHRPGMTNIIKTEDLNLLSLK